MKYLLTLASLLVLIACSTFKPTIQSFRTEDDKRVVDSICTANNLQLPDSADWIVNYYHLGTELLVERIVVWNEGKRLYTIKILKDSIYDIEFKQE